MARSRLAKNKKVTMLPRFSLARNERLKILLTGTNVNSLEYQTGGWTWRGRLHQKAGYVHGTTVLDAYLLAIYRMGRSIPVSVDIQEGTGVGFHWAGIFDMNVIVVCVGEEPYSKTNELFGPLRLPDVVRPGQNMKKSRGQGTAKLVLNCISEAT
jgi:hypothetical protein